MSNGTMALSHDRFAASITPPKEGEDGFVLRWTDYVANDWVEVYPTMPIALMRLAVLVACGDDEWLMTVVGPPDDAFEHAAQAFIAEVRG